MNDIKWSKSEKKIARGAFEKAYVRECADFAMKIRAQVEKISKPDDIWDLHKFMTEKIKEIEGKYYYRYSVLILVFARLVKDRWLDFNDLKGLPESKIDCTESLVDF